jgi:antitoxin (DNA-binding transcriptional repressor) of toxin-antitoxin stability system
MKMVNVHEAKTQLSRILEDIEKGESYIICRNGRPVADMVAHAARKRTTPHPQLSKVKILYDPTESLSPEEWGEVE